MTDKNGVRVDAHVHPDWRAAPWGYDDRPAAGDVTRPRRARWAVRLQTRVLKAGRGGKESCHEYRRDAPRANLPGSGSGPDRGSETLRSNHSRDFAAGETVFDVGEPNAPSFVLKVTDAIGRDGRGRETLITTHHGRFPAN